MNTVPRLSRSCLDRVPEPARPRIRPGDAAPGIVHIGLGAFHRAHQAVVTEGAIAEAGGDWAIVGVAPRSTQVVAALAAQDNLFSVTSLDGTGGHTKVIGSIVGVRHAASDPMAVVNLLADPAIRVVTLTVTEKAYLLDPATGRLRADDELLADLTGNRPPATVPGLLVCGLLARARADAGPIALVSCDNLPANGSRLQGLVTGALALPGVSGGDAALEWVCANTTFPATMVDRIVPASTAQTLAQAAANLNVEDAAAVAAEPFLQWVIEDRFPAGRPAWEAAGATMTTDAAPWERLKLRALNGVHSALAYLGALAGEETIAQSLALPGMAELLRRLVAEDVSPSFAPPPGASVTAYGESVLGRFANAALGHRTLQVAMDGTQKLPQRILHTIRDRRRAGASARWACLVVAAWMRFVQGTADDGRPVELNDPLADTVRAAVEPTGGDPDRVVRALLRLDAIFPPELAGDETVVAGITEWLTDLTRHGARATVLAAARAA